MNDMMNAWLTETECAAIAWYSANPTSEYDDGLRSEAEAALDRYFATRTDALRALGDLDPANAAMQDDIQDFYLRQIDRALSDSEHTLSERCDVLYRITTGVDLALAGLSDDAVSLPGYDGEVTAEAEAHLMRALAGRLAVLNTTQRDFARLTKGICTASAARLSETLVDHARETILREAMSIFMLARSGNLSSFSTDVAIEECVCFAAMTQDLDAIQKAERRGDIADSVVSIITMLLLFGAMIASILFLGPWLITLCPASGLLDALCVTIGCCAMLIPTFLALGGLEGDGEIGRYVDPICDRAGNLARFVAILAPAKIRAWFNRRFSGAAPIPPVPAETTVCEAKARIAATAPLVSALG